MVATLIVGVLGSAAAAPGCLLSRLIQGDPQSTQEREERRPPASQKSLTTAHPSLTLLAEQLVGAYRRADSMSFEASVYQDGLKTDGEIVPTKEVARARVRMRGAKLRLEVFRGEGGEHIFDYFDDGKTLTEVTARERVETPLPAPEQGRNLYLSDSVGFDGCLVGHLLRSWLAPDQTGSNTVVWAANNIRAGRYLGVQEVDGHNCHVVRFRIGSPGPEAVVTDFTLFIDVKDFWIRKRVGFQRAFDKSGDILQIVRRTSVYRNINTELIPEDVFVAPARPSEDPADSRAENAERGETEAKGEGGQK